ncbi:AAA domain-containing protein [Paraburkholderia sp. CNPSo 3157]|uniref:AAA domain-containing protein n=1 Tax=Paraburkholderia franconis TaxID=2654983 RepID=A0A7X1TL23_9BURK|nr:sigma-54-dependent Fis family transcriptional regulator [Paraburkholderia franconis]MPW23175.1 AAA domain-containing protein [Paraburkholderia franconis]
MSAWERMIEGRAPPTSAVRAVIDASWHRCLEGRVDPDATSGPPPLDEDSVYDLRVRNSRLLNAVEPLIEQTRELLSRTETVLVLTDPNGTILDLAGDSRIVGPLGELRLVPGGSWTERTGGTNAIGTALALRQPVQIHSAEHFCIAMKRWTCAATVICDPQDGTVLGGVDVSGLAHTYSGHSLPFIVSLASRIEGRLGRVTLERHLRLLENSLSYCSARTDGVAIVDEFGRLIKTNSQARAAFARIGVPGSLEDAFPIPDIAAIAEGSIPPHWPKWLRIARIERVKEGSDTLGFMLIAPASIRLAPLRPDPISSVESERTPAFSQIIGTSSPLCAAIQKAQQLAKATVPVLLLGETGVGKELFARGIHQASARAEGPFIALNCGSLSRDLLTSELFGYAEGAFTGARRSGMKGKIEAADGGTLFLDEIGEMPLDVQPHLLRVLEESEVLRLGENTPRKVNFRLIAATHRDLRAEIADGSFRADLYYRLAVTNISIPPLRERTADLPELLEHWLAVSRDRFGVNNVVIDDRAFECLMNYAWPGNVRELRNAIEGAVLMACDGVIRIGDLPAELQTPSGSAGAQDQPHDEGSGTVPREPRSLEAAEAESIRFAIQKCRGNLTEAASQLGIAKSTLYQKVTKYGLTDDILTARRKSSS